MCAYFVGGMEPENERGIPVCRAFPEGIPDEIMAGGFDHRQALGNETVLFKLADDEDPARLEAWERAQVENEHNKVLQLIEQTESDDEPV